MSDDLNDDIVTGCVKYLRAQPELVAAVDQFNIGGKLGPGIWGYRTWTRMETSTRTAVVVSHDGGWAAPNLHNTLRFPRVLLNVWADPKRDGQANNIDPLVQRRATNVFETFDRYLHRPAGDALWWGTVRVVTTERLTEPVVLEVPDGDGLIRMQAYYAITQG